MDIFAVLLGVARYLRDPRDVGRTYSNCIVAANPHAGPNDGFLVLKAKSHNGCGATEGTELVCDFEDAYLEGLQTLPTPKKVRGALDILIERQRKDSSEPSASAKKAIQMVEDDDEEPLAEAAKSQKALEEAKALQEEKAKAEAKKKKEGEEAKKNEEAKKKEEEDAKKAEEDGKEAEEKESSELNKEEEKKEQEEEKGEQSEEGGHRKDPHEVAKGGDWRVSVGSDGQYMLENTSKRNIRVPPCTVLHTVINGSVTEKPGKIQVAHLTWKPTLKTVAFLSHAGTEASVPKTMKEIIEENAVDRIYQHGIFQRALRPPLSRS